MQSIGGGAARLRQINREIVLHQLRNGGPQTKAALAAATRLSVATCANILNDLLQSDDAVVLDEKESLGGRPARVFAINPAHRLAAVLTAERNGKRERAGLAVVNGLGEFIHSVTLSGRVSARRLDEALAEARQRYPAIRAAAVSVPGWIANGEIGSCDNPALAGERLEERLRDNHGIEVAVENDMNFAALGYYAARADLANANLAYFSFLPDCCPGAGLVVNGMLVRGHTGFAGEIGALPLAGGPYSGKKLSRAALVRQFALYVAAVAAVINPDVAVLSGGLVEGVRAAEVAAACAAHIPEKHVPELVVRPDLGADRLAGAAAMALRMQSCDVGLILRKRTWCDDE